MNDVEIEKPLVGEKLTVKIVDIAFGGEGVARPGNFVFFVPFVIPGESVEIEILELKKNFGRGRVTKMVTPAPERVTPPCPYYGKCGGCQYQHIEYPAQLLIKQKQIRDLFQRVGGFSDTLIDPVVPCPAHYGYRNRIMVRTQWNKTLQKLHFGFLEEASRLVVDIEQCAIAEPVLNEQLLEVRKNPPPRGGLKVVLRAMPDGWDVPRDSFFQNNFHLLPTLVETAKRNLIDAGSRYLVDAYCGVGFFSIELAQSVERYFGIELDKLAVQSARRNAESHGATNGAFLEGRTEDLLQNVLGEVQLSRTTLIIDPPRTGCPPEFLEWLRPLGFNQIIYISCHPATLARDAKILCANGPYHLKRITPLDMFPQTQHVECVADLRM